MCSPLDFRTPLWYKGVEMSNLYFLHVCTPDDKRERDALESKAHTDVTDGLLNLLMFHPFFAHVACGLRRVSSYDCKTMGVDGIRLVFNPALVSGKILLAPEDPKNPGRPDWSRKYIHQTTKHELRAMLCHEVLHLVYDFFKRRKHRKFQKFNAAQDFRINYDVKAAGMTLPEWTLYDPQFKEDSSEQIYSKLPDRPSQMQSPGEGQGSDSQDSQGSSGGSSENDEKKDKKCPCCGKEISESNAGEDSWDSWDEHLDPHMDSNPDAIRDRIIRAAEAAKKRGNLPAGVDTLIARLREPRVDWRNFIRGKSYDYLNKVTYIPTVRSLLSSSQAKSLRIDAAWVPGLGEETATTLVIALDTSGSTCTDKVREAFYSEAKQVAEMANRIIIMTCDAAVHEVVEGSKWDDTLSEIKWKGGGGTDFRPVFEKLTEMGVVPSLLLFFTDGEGAYPENQPDYPVLWGMTKNHTAAPWGEQVYIHDED